MTRPLTSRAVLTMLAACCLASTAFAEDGGDKLLSGGVVDILEKGGVMMVLILIGSIVGLALAFERAVNLRRRVLCPQHLIASVKEATAARDVKKIEGIVKETKGPLARILDAGLKRRDLGHRVMEQSMETQGSHEIARLKRPVRPIAILATVQPLLGLLGTILGMIGTFNVLAGTSAAERVEKLAPGIGQALYTTAAGLCAAIPCVLLFHWLTGKVNRAAEEWSLLGSDVVLAVGEGPDDGQVA